MQVNADLTKAAHVDVSALDWMASPAEGVYRKMLERDGEEVARATSLVRFDPGCSFPAHEHGGGEEFLVLEGVFRDESGDYPAGAYARHPIGSKHSPSSPDGCVILVKLRQMTNPSEPPLKILPADRVWTPAAVDGIEHCTLFKDPRGTERVFLERWTSAAAMAPCEYPGGQEVFVLEGALKDDTAEYARHHWLRLPPGSRQTLSAVPGTLLWVKQGHIQKKGTRPLLNCRALPKQKHPQKKST